MSTTEPIRLQSRHRPTGLNARFSADGQSFAEYIQATQATLYQVHAGKGDIDRIVAGNMPFDLCPTDGFVRGVNKPYRRGVLLTHGLSDSPYHMRHLAAFFQRQGFRVMALLLPGHGTQPGDLLDMHWHEWARAVAYGADRLCEEADELYLAGFSAGAALSLLHQSRDERVRGLFMFSPALEITSRARWAGLHALYSWARPASAWVSVLPDLDIYKYESFCKNAAAQMYGLTRALPAVPPQLPLFVAASAEDATVRAQATLNFMKNARHPLNHLQWYANTQPSQADVEWLDSAIPERRILSSAHTAVVISPEDEYYGEQGIYKNCLHYFGQNRARYMACLASSEVWLGEVNESNLGCGLLRRLTFNPHFSAMESAMKQFIERLP